MSLGALYEKDGFRITIHAWHYNHGDQENFPHVHVWTSDGSNSLRLPDGALLQKEKQLQIKNKDYDRAVELIKQNADAWMREWNENGADW